MNWSEVTLRQFMLFRDLSGIEDNISFAIQVLIIFDNLSIEQIEKLTVPEIKDRMRRLSFLNIEPIADDKMPAFNSGGHNFIPLPLIERMETKRYLDYRAIVKSLEVDGEIEDHDLIMNQHKLLACFLICDTLPYDNTEYSNRALDMPLPTALGMAGFFLRTWQGLQPIIAHELHLVARQITNG
jgi:hypothetical protein